LPGVIVGLVLLLLDVKVLANHGWNPRAFLFERPTNLAADHPWGGGTGYDGQFSYAIAVDPLNAHGRLDQPDFRYRRIVYPLLARVLGLGNPAWIPWAMLAINLAAAVTGCIILGELLARRGASPWLALVMPFSLGYLIAVRADLTEPLALALALGGWLAFEENRPGWAACLFAVGGLTKEIALLFPAALLSWQLLKRGWHQVALLAISPLPYLLWSAILIAGLGTSPMTAHQTRPLLIPFEGVRYLADPVSKVIAGMWVLVPAATAGLWAAMDTWREPASERGRDALLVLILAVFIAVMPQPTWEDPLAILRTGLGLLVAVLIWLATAHRRALPFAAAWWVSSGLALFFTPGML
jgi:hypothetical protein